MDHTYQRPLQMPACYNVLSAEEMTYTEGGAFSINITPTQVANFCVNFTFNLMNMIGRYSFQYAVSGIQNGLADGLTLDGVLGHYWGKLNTWSKVATVGLVGMGGYYAYVQTINIYRSLKNLYTGIRDAVNEVREEQSQQAQQQAALQTVPAVV